MSEKRFDFSLGACKIYDKQEEILLEDTEVCGLLNEQQATIQSLKEENEQLRKELGDCEKFRYTVFKRLNEEHIKECSIK